MYPKKDPKPTGSLGPTSCSWLDDCLRNMVMFRSSQTNYWWWMGKNSKLWKTIIGKPRIRGRRKKKTMNWNKK